MAYTVKQIADIAGVSRRTLHYYDEIGLLEPSSVGQNGYRYYDDGSLLQLQQILFYREMGLELQRIKEVLHDPDFDTVAALQSHRRTLRHRIARLQLLIRTVDTTLMHLIGKVEMSADTMFEGLSEETQKQYEEEAVDRWGETAQESIKLWNSYSEKRKKETMQEGSDIHLEIVAHMAEGAGSPEVQALIARWHQHLRYFYEPTTEMLAGLGDMYNDHPDFHANFAKMHPDLPAFLQEAIAIYVQELETE